MAVFQAKSNLVVAGYTPPTLIYDGISSQVYRAERLTDHLSVMLKRPRLDDPTPQQRYRYQHEFRLLQTLNLMGVIRVYELLHQQAFPILVLEDFGGCALWQWQQGRALGWAEFWPLALQLVRHVRALHQAGIVHQMLNPTNLVYNAQTQQLKLIDFTVASLEQECVCPTENRMKVAEWAGTWIYLAPEQTGQLGRGVDNRTDLYSLGLVLAELLMGTRLIEGDNVDPWFKNGVVTLSWPEAWPQPFQALMDRLVAAYPEDRYQSAAGLQTDLERCAQDWQQERHIRPFPLGQDDRAATLRFSTKFYGRQEEQTMLRQARDRVSMGWSRCEWLLLCGPAGIGKSSLMQQLIREGSYRGYVLTVQVNALEQSTPYALAAAIVSALIRQVFQEPENQLQQWLPLLKPILPPPSDYWCDRIPELQWLDSALSDDRTAPAESAQPFATLLRHCLQLFAFPEHPLVLCLDDIAEADPESLQALGQVLQDPQTRSFLVVSTHHNSTVTPEHPFQQLLDTLSEQGISVRQLQLSGLTLEQILQLLQDTFHCDRAILTPLAFVVLRKTVGHPFFVVTFLQSAQEAGHFSRTATGQWQWDLAAIEAMTITENVAEILIQKLQQQPLTSQRLLRLAACIGTTFDVQTLARLTQTPVLQVFQALIPWLQTQFILPTAQLPTQLLSSHYRFAHERIRQTIYGSIDLDTRSQLHRRIARLWIQQADDPRHPESLLRIVDQYNRFCLELTPDERRELVRLNGLASQQAQAADSAVVAYRYGQMAVSLLHLEDWAMTPEQSCRVLCHYAQLAQQQGQGANAAELLQRALSQDLPCLTQIQLTRMLIRQWAWQGEGPAAIALGRKTLMIWDLGQGDAADESEDKLQTVTPAIAAEVLKLITDLVAIAWGEQPTIWADWITLGRQWVEHCQPELEPQAWLFQNLIAPTPQRLHLEPLVERQEISPEFALSYTVMECWQMRVWREPWPDVAERLEQLAQTQAAEPVMLEHLAAAWGALVLQLAVGQRSLAELSDASQALLTQAERLGMQTFVPAAQQLHQLCQRWQVADTPLSPPQPEATASLWRQTQQSLMQRLAQAFALPEQSHLTSSPSPYPMAMVQTPAMAIEQFEQAIALAQTLEPGAPLPDALTEAQRQCQQWQGQAPIPFQAWAMLLEAEIARLQDQPWAAQAAYDGAIALAQTHQQWPTLGLAAERALQFWLDHQNPAFAQIYYEQAQAAYGQWGAIAKQEHLTQQYPQWARPEPLPSLPPSPAMMASERRPHQAAHRNGVTNTGITDAGITSVGEQTPQPLLQELHRLTNEVNQRTRALTAQNAQLQAEIQGHEDTERALRLAEEKFSKVFHSSPNAIALTNLETGQHLEVNNTFCEVTGYRLDEIVGHTTLEVNLWVNPDDRDRLFKVLNQQGTVRNFEFAFRTKSGEVRTALLAAEIITIHGQRCLLGTSTDITPRKRTEDTLRCQNQALMETLDQLQTTQQELIQAEKMAALGQLIAGVAHEINSPLGAITASTRHLINFWQRHFQDLLAQWRTFDPAQQDLFFTLLDETQRPYPPLSTREQRQLRRALMQQLQDLDLSDPREIANCFVGLGISTLAPGHQALLTQPEGETLLKLAYQLSNLHASMVTISHASERAGKVVFALKNYARFDPSDRKSKANLIDGLETVLMLYHNQLKHSVEVIRQYDEPLPQIACYPDELNQVWTNLIHNSLQAMENKGVLTIAVTQQPAHLAVSITDSGPGIPPEIQAQMFTPFFTTKPPGEGSGLGLDIVRRIVDKHQGEITVASRPGQTTFTILLPLANSETPSEPDES